MKKFNLFKLLSATFLLRIVYTLLGFANSIVIAKLLGIEGYGVYIFAISVVSLLSTPTQLGLPTLIIKEFAAFNANSNWQAMKGLFIRSHQFVLILSLLICSLALLIFTVIDFGYTADKQSTLLWALLLLPILSFGAIRDAMLKGLHYVLYSLLSEDIIRPLLLFIGVCFFLYVGSNEVKPSELIIYYIGCSIVAFIVGTVLYKKSEPQGMKVCQPSYESKKWLLSSLPMGLTGIMFQFNTQLSILLISFLGSDSDVAQYRVAALIALVMSMLLMVVNQVIAPQISRLFVTNNKPELKQLIGKVQKLLFVLSTPLLIFILLFGDWGINYFYGNEYDKAYLCLVFLTLGQYVNTILGISGQFFNMTGGHQFLVKSVAIMLLINLILHYYFVTSYGAVGAALASNIVLIIFNFWLWYKRKEMLKDW